MDIKQQIKSIASEVGFHACGITLPAPPPEAKAKLQAWVEDGKHGGMRYLEEYDKREQDFYARLPKVESVIVLGVNYFSTPWDKSSENKNVLSGRIARYAWGEDYHQIIRDRLEMLKIRIENEIGGNIWFEQAVDTKPVLERSLAQKAGLGFRGKQTQLLSLQFGPWLFLSELFTDLKMTPDEPFSGSCGTCRLCIDDCPTQAIEETGQIDARKCIAYLTIEHKGSIEPELRSKMQNWLFGCDECLNVCPYTAKEKETNWRELTADQGFGPQFDLNLLFKLKSNREHEDFFSETAISRVNRKQMMRNACIVLGNSGQDEALPFLEEALQDTSDLVREHAQWAIDRIKERRTC